MPTTALQMALFTPSRIFSTAICVVKLGCTFHLVTTYFFQLCSVAGPSMLPTLSIQGDWVAVNMRARHGRNVKVGDLVLYKIPIKKYDRGLKRVIGMPGDFVSVGDDGDCVIEVPQGHCWIQGDNLSISRDSRNFGPLPLALITGKAVAQILPWRQRHWLLNNVAPVDEHAASTPDDE
ncbi:hypothetical protein CDD81_6850 [Ophiocordyceps australis]|uniref:Mitochondrial inner membrane protease subunit n=1 Tax=Ophiocordyceps australis TaxID=1399860 RepID=A0A2C5Y4K5_9HYPO|nr:hypothetical protein CDD81_6850 [Ophiocordyceps australis]